jgi:excisionase family DNA binding protein
MKQDKTETNKTECQTVRLWPEAAHILGIGRNVAYEGAKSGQIPTVRIGKRILVPRAAIDRLLGVNRLAA